MRYGLIGWLLLLPLIASAEIYQWMDNKGIVHFTDMPVPGAAPVNMAAEAMPAAQAISAPYSSTGNIDENVETASKQQEYIPTKKVSAAPERSVAAKSGKAAGAHYMHLVIVQPQNEASFFNNRGEVDLMIEVKPDFREEDKVVVLIDGKPFPTTRNGTLLRITEVDRGTHTAQVQIQDKTGQILAASNVITFYMHKASVNQPAAKSLHAP